METTVIECITQFILKSYTKLARLSCHCYPCFIDEGTDSEEGYINNKWVNQNLNADHSIYPFR